MQNVIQDNIPRRARYYQSMIDVELIERGALYKELNESYVIFFMLNDPFERNAALYTFKNMCDEEPELELDDGTKKIFVNANGVRDILNPELRALLDYMCGHEPSSELTNKIDQRIAQLKRNERWKGEFMTLYEHYQIERAEERAEVCVSYVENLMKNENMTLEKACKALGIGVDEYNNAKARVEQN